MDLAWADRSCEESDAFSKLTNTTGKLELTNTLF